MAVSNIQYTKILNDSDWIPKKLEDVYVSKLMNPYSNIESEETTFRLMPTKGEAATILRRRNTQPVEPQPVAEEEAIIAETPIETPIETPTSMPMTIDSPWFTGENLQAGSDNEAI
jgi:hypothetical protein